MTLNLEASVHISHCEKAFSKKNIITKHPRAQTWEKPYNCSDCGKGSKGNIFLKII